MKLLIISDVHGNWPALQAVLEAEADCQAIVFCGDVVDYGPQPLECLRWLAAHADFLVRGNHDNALAFELDCRCLGSFRPYSVATRAWHRTLLGPAELDFLRGLPTLQWFPWQGRHFRVAHATPQGDLFEYLAPDQWGPRVGDLEADYVLLGHTHLQGLRTFGKLTVVNPGSVGLARDGQAEACYAIHEDDRIHLKRIPYDVASTAACLRAAPLPEEVTQGLLRVLIGPEEANSQKPGGTP